MKHYRLSAISVAVCSAIFMSVAQAEEVANLSEVKVVVQETTKKAGELKKSRRAIQDELIADAKDLVRYTADVGISDNGRHNKGFAMRGVEGNRVGISIDGVSLPDSEENSLYARYGNFNSSRLTIDPELVQGIDIMRGSDSFSSGSGALGGGVNYRTLGAADLVFPENKLGGLIKAGYASKNNEWTQTTGVGVNDGKFDLALLYSQRRGKELESLGRGEDTFGGVRGIPDPAKHRNYSYLAKIGYLFNEQHRLSATFHGQEANNYTDEKSYALFGSQWREAHDLGDRRNLNVAYDFFPVSGFLAHAKVEYDHQRTKVAAISYKGNRSYRTGEKRLDEIYDRRVNTKFDRLSFRAESLPLESRFGTHTLSIRSGFSQRDFENINSDKYLLSSGTATINSSIQHPVRSRSAFVALQDKIEWNEIFSNQIGVRYDYDKLTPRDLNASCYACDKKPDSNTFKDISGELGFNAQVNETWRLGYYLSTGFRVPSASEMYFTYRHPAGNWLANPTLKAEKSLNQAITIHADHAVGQMNLNLYHTRYRDFLTEMETTQQIRNEYYDSCAYYGCSAYYTSLYQQAVNIDKAKISGLEFTGRANLDQILTAIPQGWNVMGTVGYAKAKLYGTEASLLSVQPVKVILGFGYDDPSDRWGFNARWTYLGAKKAKDAKYVEHTGYDYQRSVKPYPYLNGSATLFDVFGFVKATKHVTFRAGVYNIFNRKYHTWDSLRGINRRSTTNTVDAEGKGLERFYAPGRNYAASVEIRF